MAVLMFVPMPTSGGPPALPHLDKLVHAVVWAMLAVCTWRLRPAHWTHLRWCIVLVALLGLEGVLVELLQGLSPSRSADAFDALADFAGATIGGASCLIWARRNAR
jgi:VanZ family protein